MFLISLQNKVKRIQELRRSNAAQPVRNKKKYTRKIKYKKSDLI
jgi:glycyl-tRNA synthetase beta subunit